MNEPWSDLKLGEMVPSEITVAEHHGDAPILLDVYEAERALVRDALVTRRTEFLLGRTLARRALRASGLGASPLLRKPDRSPDWAPDTTGSITHTEGYCAAAVAARSRVQGIGIDAERVGRLTPDMWDILFTADEQNSLRKTTAQKQQQVSTIIFSAKEAYYKCLRPVTGMWLDFSDIEIVIESDSLVAKPTSAAVPQFDGSWSGRWRADEQLVLTCFVWRRSC